MKIVTNRVVIDNCIVSNMSHGGVQGVRIRPIRLEKKLNPNFDINSLQKIEYGSRWKDNEIIQKLCDGTLKYEDLRFNQNV